MTVFIEQTEPVLVLGGYVLPTYLSEDGIREVLVGSEAAVQVPDQTIPLLEWITTPRLRSEVIARLPEWDSKEEELDELILSGALISVGPGAPSKILAGLKGFSVEPLGYPENLSGADNLVFVKATEDATESFPITRLLASVIWGHNPGEDYPSAAKRINGKDDADVIARRALYGLDGLLELRLARFEPVPIRRRSWQK